MFVYTITFQCAIRKSKRYQDATLSCKYCCHCFEAEQLLIPPQVLEIDNVNPIAPSDTSILISIVYCSGQLLKMVILLPADDSSVPRTFAHFFERLIFTIYLLLWLPSNWNALL
jgi:hypothetical protein